MAKADEKFFPVAVLLIGLIILVEAAATVFVLVQSDIGSLAIVAWIYVLLKAAIGLFAIIVGYTARKN